jgi:rare lipoprotein A
MYAMTGAHATMPIPSYARVRNPKNGREIIVRINDRGPFHRGRIIDLSYTAALKLDVLRGVAPVEVERITYEEIRSGAWQKDGRNGIDMTKSLDLPASESASEPSTTSVASADIAQPPNPPAPAPSAAAKGFWIQLGAFSKLDGAEAFREKLLVQLGAMAPLLTIFRDSRLHRLQAGPYATRDDARLAADKVRISLALSAIVVERR